jgi:metallo-beta-lactamase class B
MSGKGKILGFEFARDFDNSTAKPRENGAALIRLIFTGFLLLALASSLLAQNNPDWTKPFPPHRVIGNLYYVGSKDLASYLFVTTQGNILINSSLESSVPLIRESIEKLGFKFADTKILLISHAHFDHCAGSAQIKKLTGAKYMVMDADVPVIEAGGIDDFAYGGSAESLYPPTKVDHILHDGEQVRLGDTVLVAHLTPGHTKGCTTWTSKISGQNVVIIGSPNVNPGYKLVNNATYPQISQDYERTFRVLKSLPCDVFLGAHGVFYGVEAKFARVGKDAFNPFIDPAGYKAYVAGREQAFREELKKQPRSL